MGDNEERGATVAALVGYVRDLTFWVIQPDPAPWTLERGATYRDSLNNLDARFRKQFDSGSEDLRELLGIIKDARDFVSILDGHPNLACSAVSEWKIASHKAVFERLKNAEQRMIKRLQKKRSFSLWASEVLTDLSLMNPRTLNPRQVANLRQWVGLFVRYSGRPDEDLSTAEMNAVAGLSHSLGPFVVRAAQAIGFGDWGRLFAADYQSRSDAWEEFAAAVENPRRPAEVQTAGSSPATIAAPQDRSAAFTAADSRQPVVDAAAVEPATGDQTQVNAKQLAGHAGVSDRAIRKQLESCQQARTDTDGAKWWRYCDVVGQLRNWCSNHRRDRLKNLVWPDLAKQLKITTPGSKKK